MPRSRPGGAPRCGVGRNSRHPLCPRCQHGASRGREPRRGGGRTPRGEAGRTGRAAPPCRDPAGRLGSAFGPRTVGCEGSSGFPQRASRRRRRNGRRVPPEAAPPPSALPSAAGPALPLPAGTRRCRRCSERSPVPAALRSRSEVPARCEARGVPAERPVSFHLFIYLPLFISGSSVYFLSRQLLVFLHIFFYPRFPNPPAFIVSFYNVLLDFFFFFSFFLLRGSFPAALCLC